MKRVLVFIATLLITASAANAQNPTRLSLEVKYNSTLPPAYLSVRGVETKPRWIWVTRFERVPGAEVKDSLPIRAVRVESQFNGETADIKVTLLRGHHSFEREDKVGAYHLGLNEQISVTELRSFGVEPIALTLIESVPPLPPSPRFENNTRSIEVASVSSTNVPLPAYKVTLRNLSEKNVRAIKVDVISDGRRHLTTLLQTEFDSPLIEAGGVVERSLQVVIPQKTASAYTPGAATLATIHIRTVVFDDLTFEGEQDPACRYETFIAGRRLWLKRLLPLMDQEIENKALSPADFKQKFLALTYQLEVHEKTRNSRVANTCPDPDSLVDSATQSLKLQLLRDLDQIINTRPAPPINFHAWLQTRRNNYRGWLARLN